MSDRLEDFIRQHRAELDMDEPSAQVWKHIETQIPSSKRRQLWRSMSVAASVLVLVVAAFLIGQNNGQRSLDEDLFASEDAYQEFKEATSYYEQTIDSKLTQVKSLGVEEDVLNDLQQLDEVYEELREEMLTSEYNNKEMLIDLMIKNYKTKIDILERIISKKNNNESKFTDSETLSI